MFWQFDTGFISQIDTLLDKENVSLQELMEEDDILQECKSQNQKLIQFLISPLILEEMINLITTEPPMDVNERIRYKYANIACEIMTSDVNVISDALISDESMLNKLYNFIDTDKQLNPLLASFFSKVMGLLFVKRTQFVFEFLKTKDFIGLLLNHIETSAIMDLILKLIISVDNLDLRNTIVQWLYDNQLITKLLTIFKTNCSAQRHINASQLICDIIKSSRERQTQLQDKVDGDLLLDSLESTETVSELLENIFTSRTESCLVSGLSILQSLLEYKRHCMTINIQQLPTPQSNIQQTTEFDGMPQCYAQQMMGRNEMLGSEQITSLDTERLAKGVRQVQAAIIPRLEDFTSLLVNPPQKDPIRTTIGIINKPLGATRLEVAHLITALLSSNNNEIMETLSKLNTLPILINLFFEYPWNNFLHKHVEQTITCILNNSKSSSNNSPETVEPVTDQQLSSQNKSSILVIQLLTQCQLLERIIDAFNYNQSNNNDNNSGSILYRPGYLGHLVIIANSIIDKCEPHILQQHLTEELFEKWNNFVKDVLSEINKQICTPLLNEMPNAVNLDEEAVRQQESALQQAFIEYQMQQMTRNLCTQIAFAASDFAEVNDSIPNQIDQLSKVNFNFENQLHEKDKSIEFEKICSERAKASLDNNSSDEEDLWEDRDMTFTQSANSQQKKSVNLFSEESSVFPEDSFGFSTSNNPMNRLMTSMDVDQNDAWTSDVASAASVAPIPMDTSNPWDNINSKSENIEAITTTTSTTSSIEADSWADFSSFSATEFNTSVMTTSNNNSVTTSTVLSTSENPISASDIPESTTCDEVLLATRAVASSSIPVSETNYSVITNFQKSVAEDQENVVTSSTNDNLQNGPSC